MPEASQVPRDPERVPETLEQMTSSPHSGIAAQLSEIVHDIEMLTRQELTLAQGEFRLTLGKAISAVAVLAFGMILGSLGILLLAHAIASFLQVTMGIPLWGSYGVLAILLLGIGVTLYFRGQRVVKEMDFVPLGTLQNMKENVQWIRNRI